MTPRKPTRSELSFIASLQKTSVRRDTGLFIAEGEKVVSELLQTNVKVKWIVAIQDYWDSHVLDPDEVECLSVSPSELARISSLSTPNQVLAVGHIPTSMTIDLKSHGQAFLLLDGISDPGNLGTLLRTAEWFGVDAVMSSMGSVDFWSPKVVQSAMGSLFRMPVFYVDPVMFLNDVRKSGISLLLGGVLDGESLDSVRRVDESMVVVVGSESHGISNEVQKLLSNRVSITKHPLSPTESLNATVAASILMYHYLDAAMRHHK